MPDDFQSIPMVQPVLSRQPQYAPEIQRAPYVDPYQLQRPADLPLPQLQMQPGHAYPPMERQPDPMLPQLQRQRGPEPSPLDRQQSIHSVNQIMQMRPDQRQAYIDYAHSMAQQPRADIDEMINRVRSNSGPRVMQPYSQYTQDAEAKFRAATGKAPLPAEPNHGYKFK